MIPEPQTLQSTAVAAIARWTEHLGDERVHTGSDEVAAVDRAAFDTPRRLFAVLRPRDVDDVVHIVRIAAEHRVPLYPISTGKNWGMGARVPVEGPAALLDLGDLDAIRAFDEELGFIRVEPGVTFARVQAMLEERGSDWCLDVTGSSGHTSLIGNALERGHGLGRMAERAAHVAHLEVVTGAGEVVHTGFGGLPDTRVADVCRHGVGPSLDGLFFQSGLGIVTAMTVWLQRRPKHLWPFTFEPRTAADLPMVVDRLRTLTHEGLRIAFRMFDDLRALSILRGYPWDEMEGRTPLSESVRARLRTEHGLSRWNGFGAIYAFSEADADAHVHRLTAALEPIAELAVHRPGADMPEFISAVGGTFVGRTTEVALEMAWWRKRRRRAAGEDPVAAGCGLMWICPQVPWRGEAVAEAVAIVESASVNHGFEPNVGLLFTTSRAVDLTVALVYDRDVPGQDEAARRCRDAIIEGCARAGFPLYRAAIDTMGHTRPLAANVDVLRRVGAALDPAGVIARGRYEHR